MAHTWVINCHCRLIFHGCRQLSDISAARNYTYVTPNYIRVKHKLAVSWCLFRTRYQGWLSAVRLHPRVDTKRTRPCTLAHVSTCVQFQPPRSTLILASDFTRAGSGIVEERNRHTSGGYKVDTENIRFDNSLSFMENDEMLLGHLHWLL